MSEKLSDYQRKQSCLQPDEAVGRRRPAGFRGDWRASALREEADPSIRRERFSFMKSRGFLSTDWIFVLASDGE